MLRDVFYYGDKPNVHPREQFAENLADARTKATTRDFWIINEFCDYRNFDWDFDFEFLPDEDVWAEDHNNVWPSQHQKDSGTWLCPKVHSDIIIYRNDVDPVIRKNEKNSNWVERVLIDHAKFDFSWHPDPTDPPFIYVWGNQFNPAEIEPTIEYVVPGASNIKYINNIIAIVAPDKSKFEILHPIDEDNFDFSWRPNPTSPPYIYAWGNQWNAPEDKVSLQYVVPGATEYKYIRERVTRIPCMDNWVIPKDVDTTGFDFSWEPSPAAQPYIYEFATQWQKTGGPQYVVPGATDKQYIGFQKARKLPSLDKWNIPDNIDISGFDFSWHPDDTDPAYRYVFATQWAFSGGPVYMVEGATEIKYVDVQTATAIPNRENWEYDETEIDVDSFDFSWHPYVEDQPYIYEFGTQWQKTGGPKYITPGATSSSPIKYIDTRILKATRLPTKNNPCWVNNYPIKDFDYSWHPDNTEDPYNYVFGNTQYMAEECATVEYRVPGAATNKYIPDIVARLDVNMDKWLIPDNVDATDFDFSWIPNPTEPPYIYEFGTQHQKTGGPKYVMAGAWRGTKYVDSQTAISVSNKQHWTIPDYVDESSFDFSWHPDDTEPAYIYVFATQWAFSGGPVYTVPGATEIKYVDGQVATALPNKTNWEYDETEIDIDSFDFSWHPYVEDQPYIYQFGTQWQKTGGPKYITPGSDTSAPVKYIDTRVLKARRLPNSQNDCWVAHYPIKDFDYSWHPDATEEPYIYVFGNTQYLAEECTTIEYRTSDATIIKYIPDIVARLDVNMDKWVIPDNIDVDSFDFSWVPNPSEPPYIYEFGTQWQKTGGPKYSMPGAWRGTKYVDDQKAKILPNQENWSIPDNIDITTFDFSWHPDATEPAYIYQFGTQWALTGGPVYTVPGATEVKYIEDQSAEAVPNRNNWEYDPNTIDVDSFDFSWHPYVEDKPYIYQFGTQWQKTGGPRYITPGAENDSLIKYIDTRIIKARRLPNKTNWKVLNNLVIENFDYSWHPDESETPYIYVFGNTQYRPEEMPTIQYSIKGATETKYIHNVVAKLAPSKVHWEIPKNIDESSFDFSWIPNPNDPAYIYEFATVWNARGGPKYSVPNATEYKYIEDIKAKTLPNRKNWEIPDGVDVSNFDFSWVPHPSAPPYTYQFGTKTDNNDGPQYITPNNNGELVYLERVETNDIVIGQYHIETTLEDLVNEHPNEIFWALRKNIDYANFDFEWRPGLVEVAWELNYVHVFGSPDSELTQTYFVSAKHYLEGDTDLKFVEELKLDESTLSKIFTKPDMFFVDRSNPESAARFEALKAKYGTRIQKTRYLNSWVDTINRCINRSTTELLWVLNSELDYNDFNFEYYPNPWQMKMVHVFGTQWSHWGTTFMVNSETFSEDTKYIKIIEHLSNLNFVKDTRAIATKCVHDIVVVEHGNKETSDVVATLKNKAPDRTVTTTKYNNSYLDTLKDIIKRLPEKKEHFIWVCSSVCDYTDFDFTYIIDPFARDSLHVFPSGKQKFGDTFFIDVNNAREVIGELEQLENFTKVNYNGAVKANRLPEPIIVISDDTHTNSIDMITDFPYATLITSDNADIGKADIEPMNLWSAETKNIFVTSTGATRIVVPKEIKDHVTKELYEYPYIKRAPKLALSNPLDIVFLSNGETSAEEHYEHLLNITKNLPNRVVRVDGVNGRAAAYHAAAEASETPWMFTVFAKLKVSPKFDFNWQPDRMQVPKHYIFHAKNPVNGLTYGHQAMIAYNKKLTLANDGKGLDFTLDDEHEVVPLISGVAQYNTDEFSTWRTAFREVIKLRADESEAAKTRLDVWLNKADGEFAQYSIKGALDADEYYDEVDGDFDALKLSYEWSWLKEKFDQI